MITHLDLMMRNFKTDFQQAKKRRGDTNDFDQTTYCSFHFRETDREYRQTSRRDDSFRQRKYSWLIRSETLCQHSL